MIKYIALMLTILSCTLGPLNGIATEAHAAQNSPGKVPTNIRADRMDYDANRQTVVFNSNVHVKRPDFELWAEKMTVYLDKSSNAEQGDDAAPGGMNAGEIDHIVAEKNVRMQSKGKRGTCDKATYYAKTDKLTMEGKPVLTDEKQSRITGGVVVHNFATNHSEVIKGADVTFYAPDNTDNGINGSMGNK